MHLGEVFALQRALEDSDFRRGLEAFFADIALEAKKKCATSLQLRPASIEHAMGFAAEALAAEEMFNKLEAFVKEHTGQ